MAQDRSSDDDGTVGLTAADKPAHPVSDIVTRTTPAASLDESRPDTQPIDGADDLAFLAPAQGPDELGRLGGYRVLRVLGAGGMGVVLEAEDPRLGRHVAMKVMRPRSAASSRSVERFLREARLAATVEHDHIVPIYFVGEENRVPFIVMPFLKGEPLDARLRREGKLPVAEAVRIARDVAEGLAAAHEAGLVHRDVKPGNLWLEAPRGRVKILDFGLARPGKDETHLTHSGQIIGTPAYMAPEQGRGKAVDARTDLFSLGGVLYRMVTGRQPFNGSDTMSVLTALATDTPDDPTTLNPDVPPALAALIMRLLEKDPARRPQTAREVIDALSPGVEGLSATVPEAEFAFDVEEVTEELSAARPRLGRGALIGLIAAALFVVGGGGFLGYKLFFETPTGTLVLEIDDPAVEAKFKDGEVQILGPDGQVRYRLRPGDHTTAVPAGSYHVQVNGADGVQLNTEEFTMRKAGRVVLRVTLVPAAARPAAPPQPVPAESPDRRAVLAFRPFAYAMTFQFPTGGRMRLTSDSPIPATEFTLVEVNFWPGTQLPPTFVRDTFLPMVRDLTALEGIWCLEPTNPITAADLARLAESRSAGTLKKLHVTSCELTPDTLETLKKFPRLQELSCSAHTTDDALLARLGELPGLNLLWLKGLGKAGKVTAAGTTALAGRPLREVALWSGGISDPAVYRPLAAMPGLRTLDLNMTPVGDAGLNELARCRALTSLRLTGTKVTDTGLTRLHGMRTLALLRLQSTPVTAAGVRALAAALPKCRIESDHGVFDPAASPAAALPGRPVADFREAHGLSQADLESWFASLPDRFRPAVLTARAGAPVPTFDAVAVDDGGTYPRRLDFVRQGENYNDVYFKFRNQNYRMIQGATCLVDGRTELQAIAWVADGAPWLSWHGDEARVRENLTASAGTGHRPTSLEGDAGYGGVVVVKDPGAVWSAEFDVPAADLARRVAELKAKKWRPDVLRPDLRQGLRFAVVAVAAADPGGWEFDTGLAPEAFEAALAERRAAAFYPHAVTSHVVDGKVGYTVVWLKSAPPPTRPAAPFFNGKDLTGWLPRTAVWRAEAGAIVATQPRNSPGGRMLESVEAHGDFELAFQVRLKGPGRAGVLVRTEVKHSPGTLNLFSTSGTWWSLKQEDGRITDSLAVGSAAAVAATLPADLKRDEFNAVVIRCVGKRVTVTVNGKTGIDRPADLRPTGKIVWTLGDGGEEAVFKDIKFTDLTNPAVLPAADPAPSFNGKDLTGWGQRGTGWTWADGALVVPDGRSGSRLLYSERPVGDFEMAFKVRTTGPAGHVGVLFRGAAGPTGAVQGPRWLLTDGMTAEALTFNAPDRLPDDQKVARADLRRDGFNHVVLRCVGRRLTVTVNGKVGIDRELDVPATGSVGWLHGSGAGEATFKDIRFVDLTKPTPSFRWRDLFQARPMTGWSPQGLGQWVVRDGVVTGDGANGWLMSDERYKDFELTLEYRLPAGGDGGVFLRAWPAGDITGGEFLEVQLLDDAAPRPRVFRSDEKTGGLYGIVGAKTPPKAPAGEWNALTVRMEGTRIRIAVNGTTTVDTDLADHRAKAVRIPGVLWEAGQIALQHCNSRVEYRNVQVKPIK